MNARATAATTRRVLTQLRNDPRTIALLVLVPAALMVVLRYTFDSAARFSALAPSLLGILPFVLMFLVTSIATLRERTSGTLERLLTTPMAKLDLLAGYVLGFSVVALAQVVVCVAVSLGLGMSVSGSLWALLAVALVVAVLGTAVGLLASAFAATEFQAVQFMPVVVLPQLLLCGLFVPRDQMARPLQWIADVMPLSYAVEALQQVGRSESVGWVYGRDVLVMTVCVLAAVALGALTLRRRSV
jgi:ABC-2 type transport system permease protein